MNQYRPRMLRKATPDEAEPFIALSPAALAADRGVTPARPEAQELHAPIARRLAELKAMNDSLRARIARLQTGNDPMGPAS